MQITLTDEQYETLLSMVKFDPVNPQMAAVLQISSVAAPVPARPIQRTHAAGHINSGGSRR